ncbi:MAG TPA: GNAT family N-acetyltransferase [Kofleriaceae bacterium]|nr:GNAT family N-acetyltransferase [Kofleriaceae bacterium]
MQPLTFEQFARDSAAFDASVQVTPEIDRFCSSSDWIVPAATTLMPAREPFMFRGPAGWISMMRGTHVQGWRYIEPLEASWGLACPLAGDDIDAIADDFVSIVRRAEADWEVMLLSGLPLGSRLHQAVLRRISQHYEVMRQGTTVRHMADLAGGLDGFLGRRSRNFRRSLGRADRRARGAGIVFEPLHAAGDSDALFDRIVAVENRSWKGKDGVGINVGAFGAFYRVMCRRLVARGALRTWFARHQGRDVGYVFGGVVERSYRGLQMSFDDAYRDYALGNLCQLRQIEELCAEGFDSYDLGTGLDYKRRWAEEVVESDVLVVFRSY